MKFDKDERIELTIASVALLVFLTVIVAASVVQR